MQIAKMFRIWQNGFKSALKVKWTLESAVTRCSAPFARTCPVTSSPRPPRRWERLLKTRLIHPASQSDNQTVSQSVSQSAPPTAAVHLPPHREQDPLGFIAEKSPALEIIENCDFLFPACCFIVVVVFFVLFCFSVWRLPLRNISVIMSRTPEDVSKLTESAFKVRENHDFYLVIKKQFTWENDQRSWM